MSIIQKPTDEPLNPTFGNVNIPAMELPSFRFLLGQERRTTKNVLIQSPYALGDCVCSEPAVRHAVKNFKDCEVSLVTPFPELFRHIPLVKVYNTKDAKPDWDKYYVLKCYYGADELQSEFVQNFNMAIGDYIATCMFKGQIPTADRNIILEPTEHTYLRSDLKGHKVVIHAGKHWAAKTFPTDWWNKVLALFTANGIVPTIIGADVDDGKRGTVAVNTEGCVDFRNKLSIMESTFVLQNAEVVITNDSAPLHIAASGNAWIGFISTVRHPDFVTHWRPDEMGKNQWGYKMKDFSLGRMWQDSDISPARNGAKYDVIDEKTLRSWLPEPEALVAWTLNKFTKH